ncbi:TonB-dependent receptor [Caulobacter mirabilis]|uniref:TonB-dependent receptor n=1 Tax=Caulobacter mirabilis TaxID=69666 RepID=A0A2D2B2P8_9CAUL|nr:TonB-dependent receptor [Caulobacter mirabilis]ATQ44498.1 TonB-dependent receptor [Caulobacter mirabilis]
MRTMWKAALLAGAAWSAGVAVAAAQDAAPAGETEVGAIVVTARRTEETLQTVPGAVSAFNERALDRVQAADITGLQGAVPNMNLSQGRGSSNATNIFIRGIGQPDALQTFDPAIGVYIDDVYYSRIRGTQFDLFDLERIEVLRGPQGTLYGKNTIGGALKVVTRKPGQDFRANAAVAFGSYNQLEVKGGVSGPVSDTLALGVSALLSKRDGYVEDPVTGAEYNDKDTWALRTQLAWTPTDDVRVDLSADYSQDDAAMAVGQATSSLTTLFGVPLKTLPAVPPKYDFKTRTTPGLPNSTKLTHYGFGGTVSWNITDALTLKSITAYRNLKTRDYIDIDATELALGDVYVGVDQDQTSQEFQLTYDQGAWTVVGGVYWLKENIVSHQRAFGDDVLGMLPNPFPTGPVGKATFLRTIDDDLETTSKAAYVNVSYDLTDAIQITGGLRYTDEEKTYSRSTSTFSNNPTFTANPAFAFKGLNKAWNNTSPMLNVRWQATSNIMAYARYSEGFKSGGFNGRANNPGEQAPYSPEIAKSYEAGVKTTWDGGRYLLNFTVFHNDYEDFQARVSGTVVDPGTNLPSPELTVINAGGMKTEGAELEVAARPIPGLLLDAQLGLLNAKYEDFDDTRFPGGDRSFQQPAFTPKWTARYGAQYEWDLGGSGRLTVGAQAKYRSEIALAVDNTTTTGVRYPGMWDDNVWLFDARVVWEDADRRYSAGLYGQNLSDEVYKVDAQEFSSVGNIRTAYYGAPRTFTLRLTAKY